MYDEVTKTGRSSGKEKTMKENSSAKLSAMPYIKGNKKRIIVLIISLSMFVILSYLVSYIMSACQDPFYQAFSDPYKDMLLAAPEITIGEYETTEEWSELATKAVLEKAKEIEKVEGITGTTLFRRGRVRFKSIVGQGSVTCYLFDKSSDSEEFMSYKNIKLLSGRLPEKPGEIVIDEKLWKNEGDEALELMSDNYRIVGHVESDNYYAFGMALLSENDINLLVYHPDDGIDYAAKIKEAGVNLKYYIDYESGREEINSEVGSLGSVERLIQITTGVLLAICLLVVLSLHIMDRHQEWCLMNSIGFSTGEIYFMALKELMFCFIIALATGILLSVTIGFLFETFICNPMGIYVAPWQSRVIPVVTAVFIGIYGGCQIPLFFNIRKVRTVDEIE